MHIAQSIRLQKAKHPENFCQHPKCLWRVSTHAGPKPCPTHPVAPSPERSAERAEVAK
jgi:hypothetical protein